LVKISQSYSQKYTATFFMVHFVFAFNIDFELDWALNSVDLDLGLYFITAFNFHMRYGVTYAHDDQGDNPGQATEGSTVSL